MPPIIIQTTSHKKMFKAYAKIETFCLILQIISFFLKKIHLSFNFSDFWSLKELKMPAFYKGGEG